MSMEKDGIWIWNWKSGSSPDLGSGVAYFHDEITSTYSDLMPEGPTSSTIHAKHLWPAVAVWEPDDIGAVDGDGAQCELPILITLPRGETLIRAEIYRKNVDWDEGLGDTCIITAKIKAFSAGLRPGSDWVYANEPYRVVDTDSVTLTLPDSSSSFDTPVDVVMTDLWQRLTFDLNVENNSDGTNLHDKYLMTFSVEYPDRPSMVSYPEGYQVFYKAHTVSQINSLQGALGLHSES